MTVQPPEPPEERTIPAAKQWRPWQVWTLFAPALLVIVFELCSLIAGQK